MTTLEAYDVTVSLAGRQVLDHARLGVAGGEVLGLLGPNGAGKTTLIKVLAGLIGSAMVRVDGIDAAGLPPFARARHVAYLPQGTDSHWPMRVRDVVALGRLPHRVAWAADRRTAQKRDQMAIRRALAETDVEALADRPMTALSGGERARVLLARALAVEAPILLADEPVAHLDPGHQLQVLTMLRRRAQAGDAVVVVLHDLALAARHCDRVLVLDRGRVVVEGPPALVLDDALLARVYNIQVARGEHLGTPYLLPWSALSA